MSAVENVVSALGDIRSWQEEFYKNLHQHPELSHHEVNTAKSVARELENMDCEVHTGVGGTGVVAVFTNGEGPTVLLRADMDALPVKEDSGVPYASTDTARDDDGNEVPVAHACGHDVHVTCLLGAIRLLDGSRDQWSGTVVALFQPAEETADGAQGMVDDDLASIVPTPDVAFGQHVLPAPAGTVATRTGAVLSAADSIRVTVHGKGGHGSMPQATIDPVVLASMIVVRLQAVVSREIAPGATAVLTVGSIKAGTKSNVIPDRATLLMNIRTYDESTRRTVLDAIHRIVRAECEASGSPKEPEFEMFDRFPLTENDAATTERVAGAFSDFFGDRALDLPQLTGSEDFSDVPNALGAPYTFWGVGGTDPEAYRKAVEEDRVSQDVPANHSPNFAPVIQPTLDTGTQAMVVAAMSWLAAS